VHPALLLGHPENSEVAKLPFNNSSSERSFSGKFSESFRKKTSFGRRICDFRKYPQTTSGRTSSGNFRQNLLPEVTFFKKKLFGNNLLLMDKINYKIINIIIHK